MKKSKQIISEVSKDGDEALLREHLWRQRRHRRSCAKNAISFSARGRNVRDSIPTISTAYCWLQEKRFWSNYFPKNYKIWENRKSSQQFWAPVSCMGGAGDASLEAGNKSLTKANDPSVMDANRQKCLEKAWETHVVQDFDQNRLHKMSSHIGMNLSSHISSKYSELRKTLLDNVREFQRESKSMETGTCWESNSSRKSNLERLEEGYNSLKWLFDKDPDFVYNLAEIQSKTKGGKKLMGLTRKEVAEVLKLMERVKTDPSFSPFPSESPKKDVRRPTCHVIKRPSILSALPVFPSKTTTRDDKQVSSKAPTDPSTITVDNQKVMETEGEAAKKLKPCQLMPLHIPGPDSLHQNVIIRRYTNEMDGHLPSPRELADDDISLEIIKPPVHIEAAGSGEENYDDEDFEGFTIESFVPHYSVTRS